MIYLIVSYARPQLLKTVLNSVLCVVGSRINGEVETLRPYKVAEAIEECDEYNFVAVGTKLEEASFIADLSSRVLNQNPCLVSNGNGIIKQYSNNQSQVVDVCYYNGLYPLVDISNLVTW